MEEVPTPSGPLDTLNVHATRRQVLKGGLGAGAAVVWAVPVVEILSSRAAAAASAVPTMPPSESFAVSCTGPATFVAFTYVPSSNNFSGATSGPHGVTLTQGNSAKVSLLGGPKYTYSDYGLVFSYRSSSEPSNGVTGDGASGILANNDEPPPSAYIVLSSPGVSSSNGPYFTDVNGNGNGNNLGTTMTVSSGTIFAVDPNNQIFLEFKIYDKKNGTLYQDLVVHVSCSDPAVQPATEGIFQIGSLQLYSFVPGKGPGPGGGPGGTQ
jgi:hypothetical protein